MAEAAEGVCKLCGGPKESWQLFCGASCSAAWGMGVRTREELAAFLAGDDDDELLLHHDDD